MTVVTVVQARMTSTRLPGKVLKTVLGRPLLEYQIERLRRTQLSDGLVVATTNNEADLPIVELCRRLSIPVHRGSESDVLARYYGAAKQERAEVIVRITSDCPLIDPAVIDQAIKGYLRHTPTPDYLSNVVERTYPRGMDTEVFSLQALERAHLEAVDPTEREHVTPFIYRRPNRFRLASVHFDRNESHHRWTVDTPEDFELIERILTSLYPYKPDFNLRDCLELIEEHPDWSSLNAHVEQKTYGQ